MFTVTAGMNKNPNLQKVDIPIEAFYNFVDVDKILQDSYSGNQFEKSAQYPNLLTIVILSYQIPKQLLRLSFIV